MKLALTYLLIAISYMAALTQDAHPPLEYEDIFELEYASDPQISPDGEHIIYRRMGFDIMNDRSTSALWITNNTGSSHQKLTSRTTNESQARWSPTGDRITFVSATDEGAEIHLRWQDRGEVAIISQLDKSPSNITWSPDGKHIAFTMKVDAKAPVIVKGIKKPKGAKWAETPRITDRLKHEADGQGYITPGYTHIFVVPAEGGTARQLTSGDYQHSGSLSWSADGSKIYFSSNRSDDYEYDFRNSEIYAVDTKSKKISAVTDRNGPDRAPTVSPDGNHIAYLSYEDRVQTYQLTQLYVMNIDGSDKRLVSGNLDRSVAAFAWKADSKSLVISYDDQGNTKLANLSMSGKVDVIARNMGGTSLGRPYAGGSFSMDARGNIAYTYTTPYHPADVAILRRGQNKPQLLTRLNSDILEYRSIGKVETIWYTSTYDQRQIQGWVVYPPQYDPKKEYPLMVENHGGPILNYGDRFSAEIQLYAAKGYIVFYPNPRGSTSYGEEFGNLLYNNYPGQDYNDVMDGVDVLIKKGIASEEQLFVTGGSAGGIMTAWMIGKNNRFAAAVVAKPVMNWISKTLVADNYYGYANSRYPGQPWENFDTYWKFSPLSLVGNIETPTMVMVGMDDLRTPPSEAKQLYHALKLRKIETVLVEIPGASHGIARRPSQLITKVAHTVAWFDRFLTDKAE